MAESELKQRNRHVHLKVKSDSVEKRERAPSTSKRLYKPVSKADRYSVLFSSSLLTLLYFVNSRWPQYTTKFVRLQYEYPDSPGSYDIGFDDAFIVVTFIVIFCLVRSFLVEFILKPFARHRLKTTSLKSLQRFGEQGWSVVYYSCSWTYGFYLYKKSPYYFNIEHIYLGWPHDKLSGLFKIYYLVQIASWLQQIVVLNVEQRRKDYWQMFAHHIITVLLTTGSYYYYFTRIGHVILISMDIVDVLLSSAKMLKYCGFSTACDYMFSLFFLFWVVLRHIVYNYITYQSWARAEILMADGECIAGAVQKICWTPFIINSFIALLVGLQVITCIWMYLIVKVLIKVVRGIGADDVRSDEDDDTD